MSEKVSSTPTETKKRRELDPHTQQVVQEMSENIKERKFLVGKGIDQDLLEKLRKIPNEYVAKIVQSYLKAIHKEVMKNDFYLEFLNTDFSSDEEYDSSVRQEIKKRLYEINVEDVLNNFDKLSEQAKEEFVKAQLEYSTIPEEDPEKRNAQIRDLRKRYNLLIKNLDKLSEKQSIELINQMKIFHRNFQVNPESFKNLAYKQEDGAWLVHEYNLLADSDSLDTNNSPEKKRSRKKFVKDLGKMESIPEDKQKDLYEKYLQTDPKLILEIIKSNSNILNFKNRDEIVLELYNLFLKKEPKVVISNYKTFEIVGDLTQIINSLGEKRDYAEILKYYPKFSAEQKEKADWYLQAPVATKFQKLEKTVELTKTSKLLLRKAEVGLNLVICFLNLEKFLDQEDFEYTINSLNEKFDGGYLFDILTGAKNLTEEQKNKLLDSIINSRMTVYLEPILDTLPLKYQEKYQAVYQSKIITQENIVIAGKKVLDEGEDADQDRQELLTSVLKGLTTLATFESNFKKQKETSGGLDSRVVDHLLIKVGKTVEETRVHLGAIEKLGAQLNLTTLETLAYLQRKLEEIIESCEIYHGTSPIRILAILRTERFKHDVESEGGARKLRGQINANVEKQHYGEAYENIESDRHLIFGFLSQHESGKEKSTSGYGPIRIKLNKDKIKDRSTIYMGDTSGNSFQRCAPQTLTQPHVSFILDQVKYMRDLKVEELHLDGNFISDSIVTNERFVEVNIHGQVQTNEIEEIIIDLDEMNLAEIKMVPEIIKEIEIFNQSRGTKVTARIVGDRSVLGI